MAEREARDLQDVKRLLILLLLKLGSTSEEIGAALGVDGSAVRRLIPSRKIKKFAFPSSGE